MIGWGITVVTTQHSTCESVSNNRPQLDELTDYS